MEQTIFHFSAELGTKFESGLILGSILSHFLQLFHSSFSNIDDLIFSKLTIGHFEPFLNNFSAELTVIRVGPSI